MSKPNQPTRADTNKPCPADVLWHLENILGHLEQAYTSRLHAPTESIKNARDCINQYKS